MDFDKIQIWLEKEADAVTSAPVFFIVAIIVVGIIIWRIIDRDYRKTDRELREQISSLKERLDAKNEDIERERKKLEWHETRSTAQIDALKATIAARDDQIRKGELDAGKIRAAVLEALPEAKKEILAEISKTGYFRVNTEPQSEHEALVSGAASAMAANNIVTQSTEGAGRYFIFTPTGVIQGTVKPGETITDEPIQRKS